MACECGRGRPRSQQKGSRFPQNSKQNHRLKKAVDRRLLVWYLGCAIQIGLGPGTVPRNWLPQSHLDSLPKLQMSPSTLHCRYARIAAATVFLLFMTAQLVVAQESKRVARLITSTPDPSYSRSRRTEKPTENAAPNTRKEGEEAPSLTEASDIERRAFQLTNEARVRNGLGRLQWDPELCRLARKHSEKMAHQGFFSHITPDGQRLRDRAHAVGIKGFKVIAENIAYNQGFEDPGAFAVERWMISPEHRANILYPGFQAAAVGVYVAPDGAAYFTQALIAR
jgi:uncharacterized protein YkwD